MASWWVFFFLTDFLIPNSSIVNGMFALKISQKWAGLFLLDLIFCFLLNSQWQLSTDGRGHDFYYRSVSVFFNVLHYRELPIILEWPDKPNHPIFPEPILMEGSSEFRILSDKWTAISADDKRCYVDFALIHCFR